MNIADITPILNVSNVPASLAWFESLGWQRGFTHNAGGMIPGAADADQHGPASFASIQNHSCCIFLCHDGQGSRGSRPPREPGDEGTGGVWMSWFLCSLPEFDAAYARVLSLGYTIAMPPQDQPWGLREFHLRHPDGHTFRVGASIRNV